MSRNVRLTIAIGLALVAANLLYVPYRAFDGTRLGYSYIFTPSAVATFIPHPRAARDGLFGDTVEVVVELDYTCIAEQTGAIIIATLLSIMYLSARDRARPVSRKDEAISKPLRLPIIIGLALLTVNFLYVPYKSNFGAHVGYHFVFASEEMMSVQPIFESLGNEIGIGGRVDCTRIAVQTTAIFMGMLSLFMYLSAREPAKPTGQTSLR